MVGQGVNINVVVVVVVVVVADEGISSFYRAPAAFCHLILRVAKLKGKHVHYFPYPSRGPNILGRYPDFSRS